MSSNTDSLPYLPPELERRIFEMAVIEHGPKCSAKYLLVARRLNIWLKPLIFRVFNQMWPKFPDFNKYPNSLKVEEVGRFARRLIIGNRSPQELETILSHCPDLQDLAIWMQPIKHELPAVQKLPLKRLSADQRYLIPTDYLSSMFASLTHLDVIRFHGHTWKEWEVLSQLPCLTHLIIGALVDLDVFPNLLRHIFQLRILIFMPEWEDPENWTQDHDKNLYNLIENDDRLVLLFSPVYPGLTQDWIKGGESGLDNWTFCELVSIARRRKFFLDNSPQWFARVFDWDKKLTDEGKKWYRALNWRDPWSFEVLNAP